MGVDQNVYLGPYVEFRVAVVMEQYDKCEAHDVPDDVAFCPTCGTRATERIKQVEVERPNVNTYDDFDEVFAPTDFICRPEVEDGHRTYRWIPNHDYGVERETSWDPKFDDAREDMSDLDVQREVKMFKDHYAKALDQLKEAVGPDKFAVKWGLLIYAS